MKPLIFTLAGIAVALSLAAGPAAAQGGGRATGTGGGGGGGAVAAGGGGGAAASGGGGAVSSGGGGGGGFGSGYGSASSAGSSGGSASAGSSAGSAAARGSSSAGVSSSSGSPYSGGGGRVNPANGSSSYVRDVYGSPGDRAVPRGSRPNPGGPTVGQAVMRADSPGHRPPVGGGGGGGGWNPGYAHYPYYGWAFGLGYYGFYDPFWYWGAPYGYDSGYYGYYGNDQGGRGGLRLKVEPTFAEVYVDGYYMGVVGDFDGALQKMDLEVGAHHIEIRAPGYQTIMFDVRIEFGDTVTYRGELQPLSKK